MSEEQKNDTKTAERSEEKPGFFQRIFSKMDQSMKEKADAKAKDSCCNGNDGKGGKCC